MWLVTFVRDGLLAGLAGLTAIRDALLADLSAARDGLLAGLSAARDALLAGLSAARYALLVGLSAARVALLAGLSAARDGLLVGLSVVRHGVHVGLAGLSVMVANVAAWLHIHGVHVVLAGLSVVMAWLLYKLCRLCLSGVWTGGNRYVAPEYPPTMAQYRSAHGFARGGFQGPPRSLPKAARLPPPAGGGAGSRRGEDEERLRLFLLDVGPLRSDDDKWASDVDPRAPPPRLYDVEARLGRQHDQRHGAWPQPTLYPQPGRYDLEARLGLTRSPSPPPSYVPFF